MGLYEISVEELNNVNPSLARSIKELSKKLRNTRNKEYWVGVEVSNGTMNIFADNGFDISKSIKVTMNDRDKILKCVK